MGKVKSPKNSNPAFSMQASITSPRSRSRTQLAHRRGPLANLPLRFQMPALFRKLRRRGKSSPTSSRARRLNPIWTYRPVDSRVENQPQRVVVDDLLVLNAPNN